MKRKITLSLMAVLISTFVNAQLQGVEVGKSLKNASAVSSSLPSNFALKKMSLLHEANTVKYNRGQGARLDNIKKFDRIPQYGNSNLKSINALDSVLFKRPQGYFMAGYTTDYLSYSYYFLIGPAYSLSYWQNYSEEASSYEWTLPDPYGDVDESGDILGTVKSSKKNPEAFYPFASYYSNPSLKASDGENSVTYTWGGIDSTYIMTGGSIESLLGVGACNYDCQKYMYAYYFEEGDYLFGSGPDGIVDAVANYFEKPTHEYVLDSLWINATYCTLPAGTELQLIIHKVDDDGNLTDTIATATTSIEDVLGPFGSSNSYYTLVFSEFSVFDESLGFDVIQDYLEIKDAIFIELKGFNVNGAKFAVMAQDYDTSPVNENNAYVFYYEDGVRDWGSYSGYTSLAFNLGIIYSYLFADDSTFNASVSGDSRTFNITSYYSPDDIWFESNLPDWLSYDYTFNEDTWDITMTFTAEALPSGLAGRGTTVLLKTYGSSFPILITQGEYNSVDVNNLAKTKVVNNNGVIGLTYANVYNNVSIYSLSGEMIGSYQLPSSGSFSFTPGASQKGMYLLKLSGDNNQAESLKIVL